MTGRWHTILAIDHDPKAVEVYRANVPADQVICGEVCDLIGTLPYADVILGGPPCQPYSHAGKRGGSDDDRDCVPDFIAVIKRGEPRMFLMEQVEGFVTMDDGRVMQRTIAAFEKLGYRVEMRLLDAVDFGVPQFRLRAWFWGIRSDVDAKHRWPVRTHMDPSKRGALFGEDLPAWVTTGQALGLDLRAHAERRDGATGWSGQRVIGGSSPSPSVTGAGENPEFIGIYDAQNDKATGADKPIGTIQGNAQAKGGGAGHYAIRRARGKSVDRRDHPATEPCPTIGDGSGGSGGVLRVVGGGTNPREPGGERTERDITAEPSTSISVDAGNAIPKIEEYRWSDAMLAKHPPASPASPAPTVQAKWYKGGAEELLSVDGRTWESRHPTPTPTRPMVTLRGRSPRDGGRCTENVIQDGLQVRRLLPDECARLQSMPADFVWPQNVAKTHRYRIIGNGWASLMARYMSLALAEADPKSKTVIDLFCGGGCGAVGWHGRAWMQEVDAARLLFATDAWRARQ